MLLWAIPACQPLKYMELQIATPPVFVHTGAFPVGTEDNTSTLIALSRLPILDARATTLARVDRSRASTSYYYYSEYSFAVILHLANPTNSCEAHPLVRLHKLLSHILHLHRTDCPLAISDSCGPVTALSAGGYCASHTARTRDKRLIGPHSYRPFGGVLPPDGRYE